MRPTRTLSLLGGTLLGIAAIGTQALAQAGWTTSGSDIVTNGSTSNVDVTNKLLWGPNNAQLTTDQGGSLELGGNNGVAGSGTPFIDFHFNGQTQDYNVRLLNSANGVLTLAANTFYTWANIGLNTATPLARLHLNNGAILAEGTGGSTPISGAGTRMMWIPAKTAFRAGSVSGTQWDDANIGTGSVAFGSSSKASGTSSVALGSSTTASGNYSLAGGNGSSASYDYGMAYGNGAISANRYAVALGEGTRADGWYSFAGGQYSAAYGQYSDYAFVYGLSDTADQGGAAFGDHNRSFGPFSFTAGSMNYAEGSYAVAMGQSDSVRGDRAVAIGYQNMVNGDYGTALGSYNTVNGNYCMAANAGNTVSAWYSTAFGFGNTASGNQAFSGGTSNTASGTNATSFGDHDVASGTGATAFGSYTTASGDYSMSMGNHTTAQAYKSLVMGRYNVISGTTNSWVSTEPALVIGNGTGSGINASNAITIYKNGNLIAAGTGTFSSSDARLKQDVTPVAGVLDKLAGIQPVYFSFIDTETRPAGRQLGFIAQEIEKEFPEMVMRDEKGYLAVAYGNMSAVAIQAIKEQQQRIDAISAEKSDVSAQLVAANARIAEQDARIARIEAALQKLTGECCPEPARVPALK